MFDDIRELFAQTPEAKLRGYEKGRFSFNVKGGRCEACQGDGILRISMHFLPDVYVPCEVCGGRRYNRETLEVRYKGKTIYDVLDMQKRPRLAIERTSEQIRNGFASVGFHEPGSRGGEVRMLNDGLFHLDPSVVQPAIPVVLFLIEHEKRLVADLGELGAPAGTALDGLIRLDVAHDHDFLTAADLPANGLQDLAEQGSLREFPTHKAGNIGQAHIFQGQFFGSEDAPDLRGV